jgi:hypothetical protein
MTCQFTDELIRRMKPRLQGAFAPQGVVPLDMKLRLEQLRLAELCRADATPGSAVVSRPVPPAVVPVGV